MISLFSEVFAEDVIFTQETGCSDKITMQCQLSDPNRVTTMRYISIQQRNISELYEDVVTIRLIIPGGTSEIVWYNDKIEKISETEGSSIIPAKESKLVVKIDLKSFQMMENSMMFRCTINGEGLTDELKQNLTVRTEQIGKFC